MKVVVLILLMLVVFLAGKILYSTQESIIVVIHFLLLYVLYGSGEYVKSKLKGLFWDFSPDASLVFVKHGENLKNVAIVLIFGSFGFGVNSLFMGMVKNDFEYFRTLLEKSQENWPIALITILALLFTYYLLLLFSVLIIYIKSFCILLSLNYAPATPSNRKIIDELDTKMKRYLIFNK